MHLQLFFLLFWFSGFCDAKKEITGPGTVRGQAQSSLTVQCQYSSRWRTYVKWWCRGAVWSSCKIQIKTDRSEKRVKAGRLSLQDYQNKLEFNVTLENLREDDAGSYWCGIEKSGYDLGDKVKVIIVPAPTTVPTTIPITSVSTVNAFTVPVTVEETVNFLNSTNDHFSDGYSFPDLRILLPLVIAVLLLLLVAASLLAWRTMKPQKKDGVQKDDVIIAALSSEQPEKGDFCYANLSLHQSGTSPGSSRPKASNKSSSAQASDEEVQYVTMASIRREEIPYASVCLDVLNEEPTYSNIGHTPSRACEHAIEYSSIRKS